MPRGQCKLCDIESDLQQSHILPAFAYRWLRESSGTGHLRSGLSPNQRVQDGPKRYWLCTACEGLLGRSETSFAGKLFDPYTNGETTLVVYGEWLLHFCVSVSWRVLQFFKEETALQNYNPDAIARIKKAEEAWKAFLLGHLPHPASFQQHILPLDGIEAISTGTTGLSPNINRYLMRTVDMDLCRGETTNFVYSKIGRFIILGFIHEGRPSHWQGTKVRLKTGRIEPREYVLPRPFFEYINSRAGRTADFLAGMSVRQQERIDQAYQGNLGRFVGSDEFLAMQHDVRMFGDAAFVRDPSSEAESS